MHITKLYIKHGSILDADRRLLFEQKGWLGYPTRDEVKMKVDEMKQWWAELNNNGEVMKRISELTNVEISRDIHAWVIGGGLGSSGMSHPLVISITRKPDSKIEFLDRNALVDVLIHEVIHWFVGDSDINPRLTKHFDLLKQKYANEPPKTKSHIMVLAVLKLLYTELFGIDRVGDYIKLYSPPYLRAWEIVNEVGAEKLLEEFREITK